MAGYRLAPKAARARRNPWQRRRRPLGGPTTVTYTSGVTADMVIRAESAQTTTADLVIKATQTSAVTADLTIVAESSSVARGGTVWLWAPTPSTGAITSDMVIVTGTPSQLTKTCTADIAIKATVGKTFTADLRIVESSVPAEPDAEQDHGFRMFFNLGPYL